MHWSRGSGPAALRLRRERQLEQQLVERPRFLVVVEQLERRRGDRIGERSAHTWFVLHELLGEDDVRNYDGSWTEWGNLVNVPIEKDVS